MTGRRRRSVPGVALLFGVLLAVSGCTGTGRDAASSVRPSGLDRAEAAFLAGDWFSAEREYQAALAAEDDAPWAAGAWYRLGVARLKRGDAAAAREALDRAAKARPEPDLAGLVLVAQADADRGLGDARGAAGRYRKALDDHGARIRRDHALYHLALCERSLGAAEDARRHAQEVVTVHPRSPYADAARIFLGDVPGAAGTTAPLPAVAGGPYFAQAGAFAEYSSALAQAKTVERAGFRCDVQPVTKGGRTLYAVRIGPFVTWSSANEQAGRLRGKGISAVVVP